MRLRSKALLGLGAAAGCSPWGIQLEKSELVPTVATVRWSTPSATSSWIEYGPSDDYGMATPASTGTEHEAVLLGLWERERFHYRVVTEDGDSSRDRSFRTGSLPDRAPTFEISGDPASWSGYELIPTTHNVDALSIVDPEGRRVWFREIDPGFVMVRGLISLDGESLLLSQASTGGGEQGPDTSILRVAWDGTELERIPLPMLDHDFLELPDGRVAGLCLVEHPDYLAYGDAITIAEPDGSLTQVWNAWEAFDPEIIGSDHLEETHWTHANALDHLPDEDAWLVGFRHLDGLVKIDGASGEILWGLSGEVNDFAFTDGSLQTGAQHQFQQLEDGILVFDNGTSERGWSRAVEYALDFDGMVADQVWEYRHAEDGYSGVRGNVTRFEDGSTQVAWGNLGRIEDVDPSGTMLWQLDISSGETVIYAERVEGLYLR